MRVLYLSRFPSSVPGARFNPELVSAFQDVAEDVMVTWCLLERTQGALDEDGLSGDALYGDQVVGRYDVVVCEDAFIISDGMSRIPRAIAEDLLEAGASIILPDLGHDAAQRIGSALWDWGDLLGVRLHYGRQPDGAPDFTSPTYLIQDSMSTVSLDPVKMTAVDVQLRRVYDGVRRLLAFAPVALSQVGDGGILAAVQPRERSLRGDYFTDDALPGFASVSHVRSGLVAVIAANVTGPYATASNPDNIRFLVNLAQALLARARVLQKAQSAVSGAKRAPGGGAAPASPAPVPAPGAARYLLHPMLVAGCTPLLEAGHHAHAIHHAVIALRDRLRKLIGTDDDGDALVGRAFGGTNPALAVGDLSTSTGVNVQRGTLMIAQGLVAAVRNPVAHDLPPYESQEAAEILATLSWLMRQIDRAPTPRP